MRDYFRLNDQRYPYLPDCDSIYKLSLTLVIVFLLDSFFDFRSLASVPLYLGPYFHYYQFHLSTILIFEAKFLTLSVCMLLYNEFCLLKLSLIIFWIPLGNALPFPVAVLFFSVKRVVPIASSFFRRGSLRAALTLASI